MSHISRMCSRMSSGRPLSGRGIVTAGRPRSRAWSSARSLSARVRSTRFSTSRTLVRYSSSLARSARLTCRLRSAACSLTRSRMLSVAPAALVVEEAVEGQRRVDLHRHRRVGVLPGDVRAVGHREVRLVVAGDRLLAAQHQARLRRSLRPRCAASTWSMLTPPVQHGPLLQGGPREDVAGLARMDADARGVLVEQAGDDVQPRPERGQRLEALAQLHVGARPLGPPVLGVDAVAHEQGGEALRRRGRRRAGGRFAAPDRKRLQPGQGHRHADAAEEGAAGDFV